MALKFVSLISIACCFGSLLARDTPAIAQGPLPERPEVSWRLVNPRVHVGCSRINGKSMTKQLLVSTLTSGSEIENDFRRLCNAIMRLMLGQELFVFVSEVGVVGNNNAAERQLRDDALARKTDRTSKTAHGAKRRSVISSVLQSIGKSLDNFTLESVIGEAQRWLREGCSCFTREVEARGLSPPLNDSIEGASGISLLDRLILRTDA